MGVEGHDECKQNGGLKTGKRTSSQHKRSPVGLLWVLPGSVPIQILSTFVASFPILKAILM